MNKISSFIILTVLILVFIPNSIIKAQKFSNMKKDLKIEWEGKKPGGSHKGTLSLSKVEISLLDKSKKTISGEFEFDMNSINCNDLEGEWKFKLEEHLKSADFFDVQKYPKAKFIITKVFLDKNSNTSNNIIEGDLIIKDIKNKISFKSDIDIYDNKIIIKSVETIKIDRTKWNVKYNSGKFFNNLKDKLINDEMDIKFNLEIEK